MRTGSRSTKRTLRNRRSDPLRELISRLRTLENPLAGVYASSGAFYLFLALFPAAALICSLLPLLPLDRQTLMQASAVLPDFMQELLDRVMEDAAALTRGMIPASALLLLWSSGRAFVGLMQGLDVVYNGESRRKPLHLRGLGSLYMLILMLLMLLAAALNPGRRAEVFLAGHGFALLRGKLRFLPVMAVLAVLFTGLYRFLPAGKRRCAGQIPGALLASGLWVLLGWLFSACLNRFGSRSVYGSLSAAASALLWISWSIRLILLGGRFNVWLSGEKTEKSLEKAGGRYGLF